MGPKESYVAGRSSGGINQWHFNITCASVVSTHTDMYGYPHNCLPGEFWLFGSSFTLVVRFCNTLLENTTIRAALGDFGEQEAFITSFF